VAPPTPEISQKPLPQEAKIREQDLKSRQLSSGPGAKEASRDGSAGEGRAPSESLAPSLPDDSSLLAKITPATAPQRAASLRLTEEGRKLLDAGDPQKALTRLEKTIVVDSTNAYGYFYLAKAQHRLGRYKESLNFLDVAESRLNKEPFWLAEVHALRGENYRALGMMQQAEASYAQALRLNSGNRTAADAISRLQADGPPASR
jgi:tetratricopeptide (TPR) repeat protein